MIKSDFSQVMPDNPGSVHFVGIGGAGMSGIARMFQAAGHTVTGSDIRDTATVQALREKGVAIAIGHDAAHVVGAANGFATQMQAPCRERIAEELAHREGRDYRGHQHGGADVDITGEFEDQKAHGQRAADDAAGERRHADDGGKQWIDMGRDAGCDQHGGIKLAEQGAEEKRREEQAAAKTSAQ